MSSSSKVNQTYLYHLIPMHTQTQLSVQDFNGLTKLSALYTLSVHRLNKTKVFRVAISHVCCCVFSFTRECFFPDFLQALPRWMPLENHSQWRAASNSMWTGRMMVLPTPAVWSMCLCSTPTRQPRSWKSTVSAVVYSLPKWIRCKIRIEETCKDWDCIYFWSLSRAFAGKI